MSDNMVVCPIEGCDNEFDAVRASSRINPACLACGATWGDCHAAVESQPDPGAVEIRRNADGTTELVEPKSEGAQQ